MYQSDRLTQIDDENFALQIDAKRDFRILQLTDLHLGFGPLSRRKDALAMEAVRRLVHKAEPELIVITGDAIFPFLPKTGTMNNRRQAQKLIAFMDAFAIPYTLVFGNHDCEIGASAGKAELAALYQQGKFSIFAPGRPELTGVGNFLIDLTDESGRVLLPLVLLDSNMYGARGWFYGGFDRIHEDQTTWCMAQLAARKAENPDIEAMAFFHMPPREFKEAYEKMKLGDRAVRYRHGSVGERDEYFGISKYEGTFFAEAVRNGVIRWMFCGHDHLNTLSLEYQGIRLTYGMSIDYLGYRGIHKRHIQRGGTLITRRADGSVDIRMLPLGSVVSQRVRGERQAHHRGKL